MALEPMSYAHIMRVVGLWLEAGGRPEVEIGALEPLLWKEKSLRIYDVVAGLVDRNCVVNLTTNGQLLDRFAVGLKNAGLSLLRTSWHTTNPRMFQELSGGYGNYERFYRGITHAVEQGLTTSFNRTLLKGTSEDLPEQLSFAEKYGCRLKLYTLLWTPAGASSYERFYQDWRSVIRKYVLPRTLRIERVGALIGRKRIRFWLNNGGVVEVKMGDTLDRTRKPCASCSFKKECEEGFGDYVRIDPRLHLYFCYMRRDIGFPVTDFFGHPEKLRTALRDTFGDAGTGHVLSSSALRLTVSPVCNFNCRSPGTQNGWCMEESGDYAYPKIKPTLFDQT
jgi:cyclic pyranopterin phosphate synthase